MPHPSQFPLFDDGQNKSFSVAETFGCEKPADKKQATFQKLATQIEQQRALLQQWLSYRERYSQQVNGKLTPLQEEIRQARRRMVFLLEEQLVRPGGLKGKRQRAKLTQMIVELIQGMLIEQPDAELEAIHDKYSEFPLAGDRELEMAFSQEMVENMFGVHLGDDHGAMNMEELVEKALQRKEQDESDGAPRKRRKSRKAEEAEARREEAAREISQTVRDVYRKLASALHPDRETDAAAKQQRTEQMQRVNRAYESGNLLELLNIQLEIEQIDARHLSSLSAQRMAHYIQVLREQLAEIKAEVEAVTAPFRLLAPYARNIAPQTVDAALEEELMRLNMELLDIKTDLDNFKDPAKLAEALRNYEPGGGMFDDDMIAAMGAMLDGIMPAHAGRPPRKKRRK